MTHKGEKYSVKL